MTNDCRLMNLPKIEDARGDLTFVESSKHLPFDMKRTYYVYNIPNDSIRGGHAHKELKQFVIAIAGSFDVTVDDGKTRRTITLNRPDVGLYLPNRIWCDIANYSTGSVCLVLTSDVYIESDYLRDYDEFLNFINVNTHECPVS